MVAPHISFCMHAFCLPCIIHYLRIGRLEITLGNSSCPLCKEQVTVEELKSLKMIHLKKIDKTQKIEFRLIDNPYAGIGYEPRKPTLDLDKDMFTHHGTILENELSEIISIEMDQIMQFQDSLVEDELNERGYGKSIELSINFVLSKSTLYSDVSKIKNHISKHPRRPKIEDLQKLLLSRRNKAKTKKKKKSKKNNEFGGEVVKDEANMIFDHPFFYQDCSGTLTFLHPLTQEYLLEMYGLEGLPATISVLAISNY